MTVIDSYLADATVRKTTEEGESVSELRFGATRSGLIHL